LLHSSSSSASNSGTLTLVLGLMVVLGAATDERGDEQKMEVIPGINQCPSHRLVSSVSCRSIGEARNGNNRPETDRGRSNTAELRFKSRDSPH
jgi:hypothetical protein